MSGKKNLVHEIVANFRQVAGELGFSPSRERYLSHPSRKFSKKQINKEFGSWFNLVRAAGWAPSNLARPPKRDATKLRQQYFEHLQKELERLKAETIVHKPAKALIVAGDIHAPFGHPDYIPFLIEVDKKYKCDRRALIGDEADHAAINFHDKDSDMPSAGPELKAAIEALRPLYEAWPVVDICDSNHGSMVWRKGKHAGLPRHVIKDYHDQLDAPVGWRWHHEIEVPLSNGKAVLLHHGYSSNVLQASKRRAMSLIQGHFHTQAGVQHWANRGDSYFAAQTGCGIDDRALAFAYNKNNIERPLLLLLVAPISVEDVRCDTACRIHGYDRGVAKGKTCHCIDEYLLEDLTLKPFTLKMVD